MRLSNHKTISLRMFLSIALSALMLILATALLLYPAKQYGVLFSRQAKNYADDIVSQTSLALSSMLNDLNTRIDMLIDDAGLRGALADDEMSSFSDCVERYISPYSLDYYYIKSVELYGRNGLYLAHGRHGLSLRDPFSSDYYWRALDVPTGLQWCAYNAQYDSIECSRVIYNYETYEVEGLLTFCISTDYLYDKFKAFTTVEISNMFIVDRYGLILCAKDETMVGESLSAPYIGALRGTIGSFLRDNIIVVYSALKPYAKGLYPHRDWYTMIEIDRNTLYHDFDIVLNSSYIMGIVLILLGLFCTYFISKIICTPILRLESAMRLVRLSDAETPLNENLSIHEFCSLNRSYNQMVRRLDELVNNVYRKELILSELRLKNLQAQIHPHFLFNTLQLISWKAHQYEADEVCDMLYSLSYLLEADMDGSSDQFISIRDELCYITHYAFIIGKKYENRIKIETRVPDELMEIMIPKLILQPCVENAVVHGLAGKIGGGLVRVDARAQEDLLIFTISDDGLGIKPPVMAQLLAGLRGEPNHAKSGEHIALTNIQNRIRILYGSKYGLQIESHLYEGTTITMVLPNRLEEARESS